jgi:beta-phosphoglucomutase-like phosphatase (HAD superfamily)
MGKGGGDFGARVQIRAHGGSCARTMRSLEDAIRAIGKTGLAFGAARLPRGKGLDVDFAQEKDGDRFVDELRRAGRAPLRVASKTRKLVTHVATRAEIFHAVDAAHRSICPHRTRRPTPWSTRRLYC